MATKNEEYIISLLQSGNIIRRIDGRCNDGFVDKDILEKLVRDGVAEVFVNQGFNFVRISKKIPLQQEKKA